MNKYGRDRNIDISAYYQNIIERLNLSDRDCQYWLERMFEVYFINLLEIPINLFYEENKN